MIDFTLLENEDFKEDSVREVIITPLLSTLSFKERNSKSPFEIARSPKLTSPTILGSNTKTTLSSYPDYVLYLHNKPHCVLDAKAPSVDINSSSKAEAQAFYYAINAEVKAPFYALCNGKSLTLFETNGRSLLAEFLCEELFSNDFDNTHFALLKQYLTTSIESLRQALSGDSKKPKKSDEWYLNRELPKPILNPKKQVKARYYGCTAYFTRQSWDVVAQNIKAFTDEGDVVLDPFGGSGVTAIEAMMNGRIGIHTDLNPLSIFMVKALSAKVSTNELYSLSEQILCEFEKLRPKNEKEAKRLLENAKYYPNAISEEFAQSGKMPIGGGGGTLSSQKEQNEILWIPKDELLRWSVKGLTNTMQLFSPMQLAELALLRKLIFKHTFKQRKILEELRLSLMLVFYNTLSLINLTYRATTTGGGNNFAYYYRYKLAKIPCFLDIVTIFKQKLQRVIKGKRELEDAPNDCFYQSYFYPLQGVIKDFKGAMIAQREDLDKIDSLLDKINGEKIFQADATNLKEIESQSVDFIYTDPPYGAKIPYLDLSTMWNVWLDLPVESEVREKECIEKGSLDKSRDEYHELMKASLKEMYRTLKFNRWLAFVFQHQDPQLWQLLVESAENLGFEYVGCVRQSNGQESIKKRQFKTSMLSGQLIIYFKKVQNPKNLVKEHLGEDITNLVLNHAEALIARDNGATLEEIHAEITTKGLELGFLHELGKIHADLTPLINIHFDLDEESGKYRIKKGQKFKSHAIPLELRTRYFLLSYLRGAKRQGKKAYFDDICLEIIPLLKNGVSPSKDFIREILSEIATPNKETGEWKLKGKKGIQGSFDL